jgi:tetratricopeptide (TPR) repeat protein
VQTGLQGPLSLHCLMNASAVPSVGGVAARILRAGWRLALLPALCSPAVAHPDLEVHIQIVTALIAEGPTAELYLRRGGLHCEHGEFDQALRDLAAAEKLAPGLDAIRLTRAQTLQRAGRLVPALATLDDFLSRQPAQPKARLLRARVCVDLHRYADAVRDFDEVLRLAPESGPEPYLERAEAYEARRQPDAALASITEGIERLGDVASLQIAALETELRWRRHEAALQRIDRLLAAAERKEQWHLRRAQCLAAMQRGEEAQQACRAALAALDQLSPAQRATQATRELEAGARTLLENLCVPKSG